jgi:hypothetical protein
VAVTGITLKVGSRSASIVRYLMNYFIGGIRTCFDCTIFNVPGGYGWIRNYFKEEVSDLIVICKGCNVSEDDIKKSTRRTPKYRIRVRILTPKSGPPNNKHMNLSAIYRTKVARYNYDASKDTIQP